jgi:hypothetical protein
VRISIVRYGEREVAGMTGGELIYRAREDGEESIHFTWEYNGVYDTGEYPAIKIEMECSDGRWKEKIALWDAILDSMQPLFDASNERNPTIFGCKQLFKVSTSGALLNTDPAFRQ